MKNPPPDRKFDNELNNSKIVKVKKFNIFFSTKHMKHNLYRKCIGTFIMLKSLQMWKSSHFWVLEMQIWLYVSFLVTFFYVIIPHFCLHWPFNRALFFYLTDKSKSTISFLPICNFYYFDHKVCFGWKSIGIFTACHFLHFSLSL